MQAVEFLGKPHDDLLDLPAELHSWNGQRVRTIMLDAESEPTKPAHGFTALSLMARGFRFERDEANAR